MTARRNPGRRTPLQETANSFDEKLFGLLDQAKALSGTGSGHRMNERERADWKEVAYALSRARPYVRNLMHKDDRTGTE